MQYKNSTKPAAYTESGQQCKSSMRPAAHIVYDQMMALKDNREDCWKKEVEDTQEGPDL